MVKAWTIDFMIGNEQFLGKGLASKSLQAFADFVKTIDAEIKQFLIDPTETNNKAIHVYEKAGFSKVAEFAPDKGHFLGMKHFLMLKKLTQRS